MPAIFSYAYAEDPPSCAVIRRLVRLQNELSTSGNLLRLKSGFPLIKGGWGDIRKIMPAILNSARMGNSTIILVDMDNFDCPIALLENWLSYKSKKVNIPSNLIFRIARREVESWIMADIENLSNFLNISAANFCDTPDDLRDPKQYLMNLAARKGKSRKIRDMAPKKNASIGISYNEVLCEFIDKKWDPIRASRKSPSLQRAVLSLRKI